MSTRVAVSPTAAAVQRKFPKINPGCPRLNQATSDWKALPAPKIWQRSKIVAAINATGNGNGGAAIAIAIGEQWC
jgi:hypothetical protein